MSKVIRAIPYILSKHYSLSLSIVDVKYNFIGFDPKGIRFSFDVQNVVTAFIGEDLYKDKMTSLREAVQNSVDSCRYKSKVLNETYVPSIKILITNSYLRIEDNGAGMDEFIIENFFGRLASSFYEQEKIKSKFEAIGQFGVGVFSYFLLSEFIDIETKTIKSPALKFRFDKDPKSYFHFYDKTDRDTPGTTITMYLKETLVGKITFNLIEAYIKKIFKHIEIPIEVNSNANKTIIEFQPFEINSTLEIKDKLKLQDRRLAGQLTTVIAKVNDEDIEGICALIVGANYLETFKYELQYFDIEQFRTITPRHSLSQISISQKGVFVNKFGSSSLSLLIGDIDLKTKVKINIDRNDFTDIEQIYILVQRFEIKILHELFSTLEGKYNSDEERAFVSDGFINNYLNYNPAIITQEYIEIIINAVYVKSITENQTVIFKIKNTVSRYDEFILTSDKEDSETIYSKFKKPVIVASESNHVRCYQTLSRLFVDFLGYNEGIVLLENNYYKVLRLQPYDSKYIADMKTLKDILGTTYFKFTPVISKKIAVSVWQNKLGLMDPNFYSEQDIYFNYNHSFIKYIITNHAELTKSPIFKKIVKAFFEYIVELIQQTFHKTDIEKLNDIIQPLNQISKLKKIKLSDF